MSTILHITTGREWKMANSTGVYCGDTLHTEGFIHCSTVEQVAMVVNAWFQGQTGLVMLCIDPGRVRSEIRYEAPPGYEDAGDDMCFPHIYGPLDVDAVFRVVEFDPGDDGAFDLPDEIAGLAG